MIFFLLLKAYAENRLSEFVKKIRLMGGIFSSELMETFEIFTAKV